MENHDQSDLYMCPSCFKLSTLNDVADCYFCRDIIVIDDRAKKIREIFGKCIDDKCLGCYSACCYDRLNLGYCINKKCHLNSPFNIGKIFECWDKDVFCCERCNILIREDGLRPDNYGPTEDEPWSMTDYNKYYHKLKHVCDEAINKPDWKSACDRQDDMCNYMN